MPVPPGDLGYFDKVNYVIDAWSCPCEAPWYIYVETLKPALLKAFITLATFGFDDVARGYFRPRGLGRRTGKRGGRGKGRGPIRFPEFGEEIGKRLPGADEVKGQNWSRAGKTLWRIDTLLQQGLFYWLVADVTVDLAFNWTSVLYETVWCQAAGQGRFSYSRDGTHATFGGNWWGVRYPDLDYEQLPCFWVLQSGNTGTSDAMVAAGVDWEQFPGEPPPTSVELRIVNAFTGKVYHETGPAGLLDNHPLPLLVNGMVPAGVVFNVQTRHNTTIANYRKGFVTCIEGCNV